MRITFLLSSQGGSPLQVGLERGLCQLGHQVEYFNGVNADADLLVFFNQCSHTTHYRYSDFPETKSPIAFVDTAEYGFFKRLPAVAKDYQNTFSAGSMAHDTKNTFEQGRMKRYLEGKSFPYFIREYVKYLDYPDAYHPIDYPLYFGSECPYLPNRETYLKRPLDLYLRWGESHPWRGNLTAEMQTMRVKSDVSIVDKPIPRIPQQECFRLTEQAKCSVSFDGYGSSSFRLTEVLCRTALVRGPLSIKLRDDLTDGVNCLEFKIEHDGERFVASNIAEKIRALVKNPELGFLIYEAGYRHCMEHYTEKATAAYFLKTVEAHDWNTVTPLEL